MMMTDPLADMLTRIRNAIMMRHEQVTMPHSRFKESVLKVLKKEGFVVDFETVGSGTKKALVVALKYATDGTAAITNIRKVSKPGRRFFGGYQELKPFRGGLGVRILTTSKGVVSEAEARNQKLGGEILVEVW
ncbi:MAG: 30S ribosomal protein S8 [Deltaproteobacteria bacterium RIFCSPLOWO2_02_FULL_46_8]|nr:MAG: 30S ribosomal protein S8 [Deltaproteobacteria bacterium RIFCSPLOWO2_02_FULL_46_8]